MNNKLFSISIIGILLIVGCSPQSNIAEANPVSTAVSYEPTEASSSLALSLNYPIVDTAQAKCYDNTTETPCSDYEFTGQDAQYSGNTPHYQDNGDGTVTDLVTGLMWQQDPGEKRTFDQAVSGADSFALAGYDDWRLPTIKELYSLILFDGTDSSGCMAGGDCTATPFIDTRYFKFQYGDTGAGERIIDSQFATSTKYISTTMLGDEALFGVNFADGRIKGYGLQMPGQEKTFYVLYVRGNANYGKNNFADHDHETVTDRATGLTWMKADSGTGMDWPSALGYCESLDHAGFSDWRLPNVKELQSLVDYSRSPSTTGSAAIDPIFAVSSIPNEAGQIDYPFYWSSTTHADSSGRGTFAAYVSFGRATGYMFVAWLDVHGAGAQRSDPKTGHASDYPQGHGPQGDAVRIENYVRCVRGGNVIFTSNGSAGETRPSIQIESTDIDQGQLIGEPPTGGMPPQEAILACAGLSTGSRCSFTPPDGTIHGSCQMIEQHLACVPANRP